MNGNMGNTRPVARLRYLAMVLINQVRVVRDILKDELPIAVAAHRRSQLSSQPAQPPISVRGSQPKGDKIDAP